MAYIEKLTVNGSTYDLKDGQAARIDDTSVGADAWSSKNTIDRLCPAFSQTGAVVACEPVAGYPLEVSAEDGATAITRCGKNLWNLKSGVSVRSYISASGTPGERYGYDIELPPGTYTAHAEPLIDLSSTNERYMYGYILNKSDRTVVQSANLIVGYTKTPQTFTLAEGQVYMLCHGYALSGITQAQANKMFNEDFNVQIEPGSGQTAYEPYQAQVFAPGDAVVASAGTNCLFANRGSITVTGRKDPKVVIEKLTNAIVALGGNV